MAKSKRNPFKRKGARPRVHVKGYTRKRTTVPSYTRKGPKRRRK